MTSVTRKPRRSGKASAEYYHLAVGNSLLKEGRAKERLTPREAASYASAGTKVSIAAARGGHESFQVFIAAPAKSLKDVTLRKTALIDEHSGRKIDARHVSLFVVESVKTRGGKPDKSWPDILHPYKGKFDVPKGHLQLIGASVYVPKGTKAGVYHGQIVVRPAGAPSLTVQGKLTVWDFALPDKTHLATVFGFTTLDGMSRFYDFYPGPPARQGAMVRKYLRFLNDRRINTLFYGYITTRDPRIVSIKEGKNGKLSYDFTKLDPYLRLMVKMGMRFNIFVPPFWQSGDLLFKFNPLLAERFGHLGEKVFDSPEFDRAVAELLDSYVRLTVANYEPFELEGLSDIWCPNLGESPGRGIGIYDKHKDFYERRKRAGDEVWWYLACEPHPFPNWFVNYPLVDCRITGWLTWRYGLDGLGYWNTNVWNYEMAGSPQGLNYQSDPAERWPNRPWDPTGFYSVLGKPTDCPGCGQLVYPGPDGPISSMRLEAIRDGIEDYEYLRLLERKTATLAKRRSTPARQKLLRASQRVLSAVRRAANRTDDWEQDGKKLLALRNRIGLQIEALTCALRK
jgi:hypothetical protein